MNNNIKLVILISGVIIFQCVFSEEHIFRLSRQVEKDIQLASELDLIEEHCNFENQMHPASKTILANYQENKISTPEFLRYFSLPNSGYIDKAGCVIQMLERELEVTG